MKTKIESLLFISHKPLTVKAIVTALNKDGEKVTAEQVVEAITELKGKYNTEESGVNVIEAGNEIQMVTSPATASLVKTYLKDDMTGELTPASLETLTVIAYRGPISKPELEQIRGVNCSLIIRNLLIRGLITSEENKENVQTYFSVTVDFLKHLGYTTVSELPEYEKLHAVENLEQYIDKQQA
jgi:segregation and condensation protein B